MKKGVEEEGVGSEEDNKRSRKWMERKSRRE